MSCLSSFRLLPQKVQCLFQVTWDCHTTQIALHLLVYIPSFYLPITSKDLQGLLSDEKQATWSVHRYDTSNLKYPYEQVDY